MYREASYETNFVKAILGPNWDRRYGKGVIKTMSCYGITFPDHLLGFHVKQWE
jgi:hypothetical protein